MYVGEHGNAELSTEIGKNRQRRSETQAPSALRAGAIGLIERCLVDEPDPQSAGNVFERRRHFEGMLAALQCARAGNQRERQLVAKACLADRNNRIGRRFSPEPSLHGREAGRLEKHVLDRGHDRPVVFALGPLGDPFGIGNEPIPLALTLSRGIPDARR